MVQKNAISNSLLFAGPDGIGKSLFAEAFAKQIICADDPSSAHLSKLESGNHPDIHIYRPEGKIGMHSISSLRSFNEEVYLPPYEATRKVFIIHDAERMLTYSANALLKTFEEPSLDSIIILLSRAPELLLPTIMSRCTSVYFHILPENEIAQILVTKGGAGEGEAKRLAALSRGSAGNAFRLLQQGESGARDLILGLFVKGACGNYTDLAQKAREISDIVDASTTQVEESAKAELKRGYTEKLSAVQQQAIEKEVDGIATMKTIGEAQSLFDIILSWYRDLHLLVANGNRELVFHRDYLSQLDLVVQRGSILPIEVVQKAINEARLALERSTPLNFCLESLFLKLNLL